MRWGDLFRKFTTPRGQAEGQSPVAAPAEYRVYTSAFDREIRLAQLDETLGPMLPHHAREYEAIKTAFFNDLGEWCASANSKAVLFRNTLSKLALPELRAATAITFLLDLSGSMRGQRILMCLSVIEIIGTMLEALGLQVEILGYTTTTWRGGQSRLQWLQAGKPRWPGRLNDLLHIVITAGKGRENVRLTPFKQLLRPDLLKENVDGEALIWAAGRLKRQAAQRRQLVVVSDGAPVDDSTLSVNPDGLLWKHLIAVVAEIEAERAINLAAIGIDYDVRRLYKQSHFISTADEMLEANFAILRSLYAPEPQPTFWDIATE